MTRRGVTHAICQSRDMQSCDVRDDHVRRGQSQGVCVGERDLQAHTVDMGVAFGRLGGKRVVVDRKYRTVPQFDRRDCEHSRPRPDIDKRSRRKVEEQLQASARGRVLTGPERHPRVDFDVDRTGDRIHPRRSDTNPSANINGLMMATKPVLPLVVLGNLKHVYIESRSVEGALKPRGAVLLTPRHPHFEADVPAQDV